MWIILFSLIQPSVKAFDWNQSTCPAITTDRSLSDLQKLSFDSIKVMETEWAKTNMKEFCQKNLMTRFLNSRNVPAAERLNKSAKDLEVVVDSQYFSDNDRWGLALLSTKKSRTKEFSTALRWKSEKAYQLKDKPAKIRLDDEYDSVTAMMGVYQKAACARENLLKTFSCVKALEKIRYLNSPHGFARIMTPDAWRAIYESNAYDKGIHAAAEMLQTLSQDNGRLLKQNDNIFELLISSFKRTGFNQSVAEDAAWNLLGAISNGGPNTRNPMESGPYHKGIDLDIIANSLGLLDYLKQEKGWPLFSYPKNIKTDCDSAKPYHFWMSAYTARELSKTLKLERSDVAKYILLAEKGYNVNRDAVTNHETHNALFNRDNFDPAHEVIRMDLAYSAAGAVFGADSAQNNTKSFYDVDRAIVDLEDSSGPNNKTKMDNKLDELRAFESIFQPDTAIKSILTNAK